MAPPGAWSCPAWLQTSARGPRRICRRCRSGSMVIKHICVEGWSYIGGWTGVPLRDFLERIGADPRAKYVAFKTADDYPSSIDMATALHPQTLLATQYADEPSPILSDIRCACAWRPSLDTRTRNGSPPSR